MGRMTLDPLPHIDPFMTVLLPAILFFVTKGTMMFGGAKPVPVSYWRLRHPARDMMLVALAGPVSNFLLAILFLLILKILLFPLAMDGSTIAVQVMHASAYWNLLLAAFNLVPIPPLDGSRVMSYLLPENLRAGYNSMERFGMLIIIGLLYTGVLGVFLYPLMDQLWNAINAITGGSWA